MGNPVSLHTRRTRKGCPYRKVAKLTNVSESTVKRLKKEFCIFYIIRHAILCLHNLICSNQFCKQTSNE